MAALLALAGVGACTERAVSAVSPIAPAGGVSKLTTAVYTGQAVRPNVEGVIANGVVMMGVVKEGALNVEANYPSSVLDPSTGYATTQVGLRLMDGNVAATEAGCDCEGWGVGDVITNTYGGRNLDADVTTYRPISPNIPTVESWTYSDSSAKSVVIVNKNGTSAPLFRVTHEYYPSQKTRNLYEVKVSIQNISGAVTDVRYRRTMDWDIEPSPFREYVTMVRGTSPRIERMTNNPFQDTDVHHYFGVFPLDPGTPESGLDQYHGDAYNRPIDAGANFDFRFGILAPGASKTFYTYYGAAKSEQTALDALGASRVEAYSLAQASKDLNGGSLAPSQLSTGPTFAFGFREIEGTSLLPDKSPVVTHTVSGTLSATGWYTDSPLVHFNVSAGLGTSIATQPGCADVTVSSNTTGTTYICRATNTLGLTTVDSVSVKRDATVPVVTPTLTGTLSNGWYSTNVGISWNSTTTGPSGIASSTCVPSTISTDGTTAAISCTATSGAGVTGTGATAAIKRDATKPLISISGPSGSIGPSTFVTVSCTASDATSLVNTALTVCPTYSGPAYGLGIGLVTLSASATDFAGNVQTASSTFTVLLDATILCTFTRQFVNAKGDPTALCATLAAAQVAMTAGNTVLATTLFNSYIAAVIALKSNEVSDANRQLLIDYAIALGGTSGTSSLCNGALSNGVGNPNNGNQGHNGKCNGNSGYKK